MTPEEYERIKAAEKEHLRALRKLKQTLRQVRRRQSTGEALGEIARAPDALDASSAMIDQLAAETARYEARLDLALEATGASDTAAPSDEASEAALRQERARTLLRQLREEVSSEETRAASSDTSSAEPRAADADPLPEKTIGRMDDGASA